MFRSRHLLALLLAIVGGTALAGIVPFTVSGIRVEGNQITEVGTVFNYMSLRQGDRMDNERATQTVRELYRTNFFKHVTLLREGTTVIVKLEEQPVIDSIEINGVKEFSSDSLKTGLKQVGLTASRIFDRSLLEAAQQSIKKQYVDHGLYSTTVDVKLTDLERNRVAIAFNVVEGQTAKIRRINIIGNKVYSEDSLLNLFVLSTPGWLTWLTRNDRYSKDKLNADLESLRSYYQDRGYLEFAVDDARVSLAPDLSEVYVNLALTEGDKYTVGKVELVGQLLLPDKDLRNLVILKPGDVFSRSKLTASVKAIQDRLGNEGYAFARVQPQPTIHRDTKIVDYRITVEPGQRAYVRRVSIVGNYVTRDDVIRRYILQLEGTVYDANLIKISRDNIDRTGFFETVNVDTKSIPDSSDQVDIEFQVKEKLSGSVQFGIGYGTGGQISINTTLKYDNLLGSGNSLALSATKVTGGTDYSLSQSFPNINAENVSWNYNFYYRRYSRDDSVGRLYSQRAGGVGIGMGFPVSALDRISTGINIEQLKIGVDPDSPQLYIDHVNIFGAASTYVTPFIGWSRDTRDSLYYPMRGRYQNLSGESTLPVGKLRFYRLRYQFQQYTPVSLRSTLLFNAAFDYGHGFGGKPLPFFKNYYGGGIDTIRAFDYNGVGPVADNGDHVGGTKRGVVNLEYLFPFPGSGQDRTLRLGVFTDMGSVWASDQKPKLSDFSAGYGIGLNWASPIGPFRLSLGVPWRKQPNDRVQSFQFTFGTLF